MLEITKLYDEAVKERDIILESLVPLREKEEALIVALHTAEADLKLVRKEIVEREKPRLAEVSKIISALAPKAVRLNMSQVVLPEPKI